jgi:glyoxylase I family protein
VLETTALHQVRLTVTDLARSRAFFSEVLGFQITAELSTAPWIARCR